MSLSPKKLAAITAAISAYLEAERQAAEVRLATPPVQNSWGASGRQESMQMKMLFQGRLVRFGR